MDDIVKITFKSLTETVKNQGNIIKDLTKKLRTKINISDIKSLLNLKANNSEVFQAFDNLINSIENLATISQFNELNNDKVSKSEIIYYLKAKPSLEDIENLLNEKIDKKEFNNKFESLSLDFEKFKNEVFQKIDDLATKKELKELDNREKNNIKEVKNILDTKSEKENVFNSLKLKCDKNEMNTILDNKLDKSDLANILKLMENKLNKDDFNEFKKNQEKELNHNETKLDNNEINIIKKVNEIIQDIKKKINTRIDLINTDISKLTENMKSKYDSMNILINSMNKRILNNSDYKNLLNKKLDIEKFNSLIKNIKNNLEHNFLQISKTNSQIIEQLIDNKIDDINTIFSNSLKKQNSRIDDYIKKNRDEWAEYQIRVQSMINKINSENKLEIQKLKNEYFEKIDDKISEKFYNLTEETKNKNNQNHNSSLNHSSNENEINKNNRNDSQIKEKCEINEIKMKLSELQNEINNNKIEFSTALDSQSLINDTLCEENKLGKWCWTKNKLKNNFNIIWDIQEINTFPDNYTLENDKSIILIKQSGVYQIIFGFYSNNKKPNIQIIVNNEVIISNSNKTNNGNQSLTVTNSGFYKANKNIAINGGFRNTTGITLVDYINLENNSKLGVFYNGEIGKGFISIKKIINLNK